MSYKPSDLYVGVIEFFGILVPGATLALLQGERLLKWITDTQIAVNNDAVSSIWFWVGSYLLGHLLLGAGEGLDKVYDALRGKRNQGLLEQMKDEIDLPDERKADRKEIFTWANLSASLLLIGLTLWRYRGLHNWTEKLTFEYYILMRKAQFHDEK